MNTPLPLKQKWEIRRTEHRFIRRNISEHYNTEVKREDM